jgi:hypothetical protein
MMIVRGGCVERWTIESAIEVVGGDRLIHLRSSVIPWMMFVFRIPYSEDEQVGGTYDGYIRVTTIDRCD